MVFLKTRPFLKWNNAEFTNVSSLTSLFMWSTHFTLSCRALLLSLPTSNSFFQFVSGRLCLGSLDDVCFSDNWRSSELDLFHFWTSDIQDLPTSCRKFLYFTFLFVFSYCTHSRVHSLADTIPPFSTILQFSSQMSNNGGTLHQFTVLNNSVRLLYFHVCFSVPPSCVHNCCIMDCTYHPYNSFCNWTGRLWVHYCLYI